MNLQLIMNINTIIYESLEEDIIVDLLFFIKHKQKVLSVL